MIRAKKPEAIRRTALRMAARKFRVGCEECALGYLAVAEEHGASF